MKTVRIKRNEYCQRVFLQEAAGSDVLLFLFQFISFSEDISAGGSPQSCT